MVMRKKAFTRVGAALTAVALVVPLIVTGTTASAQRVSNTVSFPRAETLYTSGTSYGEPTNFNPLNSGSRYMGTMGLLYEPLFLYDPIHNKYLPWLATSGSWTNATTYTLNVRNGVSWSNGSALTGADVAYTINLANTNPAVPWSNLHSLGLIAATATGNSVSVTFNSPAPYAAWQNYLWNQPVLPQAVWSQISATDQVTVANLKPVASGPMTLVSTNTTGGVAGLGEACYQTNPSWWGAKLLGLAFKFKYLCDSVNGGNNVELSAMLSNNLDWSNNFLPGINSLIVGGGDSFLQTYYPTAPFMLSANTVWLELNTSKAPMSNVNFRRAVAYGVNEQQIVTGDYGGIVAAANPTGLLPNLAPFINNSIVKQYGFSYNPAKAKAFLKASGYNGQMLTLQVPTGWSDWVAGVQIIAQDLGAIGIHISLIFPQANDKTANETSGNYDMCLDNNVGASSDPWSYFDHVYQLPIGGASNEEAAGLNMERYTDPGSWALVQKAADTPATDMPALVSIYGQLEKNFLQTLPEIPVWYNGAWFQGNDTYWSNFPSSANPKDQNVPVLWGGYLGAQTTVYALAALKPVPQKKG